MAPKDRAIAERKSVMDYSSEPHYLIGIIADKETTLGFVLAGIGETMTKSEVKQNFLMVTDETTYQEVERFFLYLYNQKNIGVILLSTEIFKALKNQIAHLHRQLPILMELPSKSHFANIKPPELQPKEAGGRKFKI